MAQAQQLKQKPYNFTTIMLRTYLSTQGSVLSASVINKTHTSGQKLCGIQPNAKVCGSESAIFHLSFLLRPLCSTTVLSTHCHFSMKLMLITA